MAPIEVKHLAHIGHALRLARKRQHLTQLAAAERAGVGVRLWNEVENYHRANVAMASILAMCAVAGVVLSVTITTPRPVTSRALLRRRRPAA